MPPPSPDCRAEPPLPFGVTGVGISPPRSPTRVRWAVTWLACWFGCWFPTHAYKQANRNSTHNQPTRIITTNCTSQRAVSDPVVHDSPHLGVSARGIGMRVHIGARRRTQRQTPLPPPSPSQHTISDPGRSGAKYLPPPSPDRRAEPPLPFGVTGVGISPPRSPTRVRWAVTWLACWFGCWFPTHVYKQATAIGNMNMACLNDRPTNRRTHCPTDQ